MNELKVLRKIVDRIDYPEEVVMKVNGEITGMGFFPAADGLIGKWRKFGVLTGNYPKTIIAS